MAQGAASRNGRQGHARVPHPSESGERLVDQADCTMAAPPGYGDSAFPRAFDADAEDTYTRPRRLSTDLGRRSSPPEDELTTNIAPPRRSVPAADEARPAPRRSVPAAEEVRPSAPPRQADMTMVRPPSRSAPPQHEVAGASGTPKPADMTMVRPPSKSSPAHGVRMASVPPPPRDLTRVRPNDAPASTPPTQRTMPTTPSIKPVGAPPSSRASIPSAGEINRKVRRREQRKAILWGSGIAGLLFLGGVGVFFAVRGAARDHAAVAPASAPLPVAAAVAAATGKPAATPAKPAAPAANAAAVKPATPTSDRVARSGSPYMAGSTGAAARERDLRRFDPPTATQTTAQTTATPTRAADAKPTESRPEPPRAKSNDTNAKAMELAKAQLEGML